MRFAFVPVAGIPAPRDRCRGFIAERIARDAFMQVIAVRADFDQAAVLHLAQLCPGDEIVAGEIARAIGHDLTSRQFHPTGHRCDQRRIAVGLQQREHPCIDTAQAIVEGQQHRPRGQGTLAGTCIEHLLHADRVVRMRAQPVQMRGEIAGGHRIAIGVALGGDVVANIVVAAHEQARLRRRGKRHQQQCDQQQRQADHGVPPHRKSRSNPSCCSRWPS